MPRSNPDFYLARLHQLAAKRGGAVLSKRYRGDIPKLKFRCGNAHVFAISPGKIKGGQWCPRCAIEINAARKRARGLAQLMAIVRRKGGSMDPAEYVHSHVVMGFRCAREHSWRTVPNAVVHRTWCPRCAAAKSAEARRVQVDKRISEHIKRRGGVLLRPGFVAYKSWMRVRCREGHHFEITPESLESGLWCTVCREHASLNRLRAVAAHWGGELRTKSFVRSKDKLEWRCALGHGFSKSAAAVLVGGWCYKCRSTCARGLRDLQRIARARAGDCLSAQLPAAGEKARWRCQFGHEWKSLPSVVVHGSWCPKCGRHSPHSRRRLTMDVLRQTALDRGGRCLSEHYTNNDKKLRWECARGHQWTARVSNVRQGSWCPKCAHRVLGTIESLRAMATERGGRCLSRHWDDHAKPVEFACAKGHRFHLSGPAIRSGVWCPKCADGAGAAKRRR
ncbi:MAG: hypothetical protein ABIU54_04380 [Candidatus Eisenbacteria bacterium]